MLTPAGVHSGTVIIYDGQQCWSHSDWTVEVVCCGHIIPGVAIDCITLNYWGKHKQKKAIQGIN